MGFVFTVHRIFGEMVLPILIIVAAIWFTVTWKPDQHPTLPARVFPILVDIQATLGLIYWIYLLAIGSFAIHLGFPFILHPIIGILSAGVAHMAARPKGNLATLGRWAPLAACGVLFIMVLGLVILGRAT
jgi:heme A synthase